MPSPVCTLRRLPALLFALLLAPALSLVGCDSPDADQVDLDLLFAPPTALEVEAVERAWEARRDSGAYEPGSIRVEYQGDVFGDGSRIVLLSHTTGHASFRHYGAVRFPPGDAPADGWPVVVYNHGGARGFDLVDLVGRFVTGPFAEIGSQSVVVMPTFRSETMTNTPMGELRSEGAPSVWDRDVDDMLALLNATLETFSALTDDGTFVSMGGSRGGAVALLAAMREPRIRVAVDYFGPTNLFSASSRAIAEEYVAGTPADVLAAQLSLRNILPYLIETALQPVADGTISYEEARFEMIRRSAAWLPHLLPNTIAHHHECDSLVPFEHFQALEVQQKKIGAASELYSYDRGCPDGVLGRQFHGFSEMPEHIDRTLSFMKRHGTMERDGARP